MTQIENDIISEIKLSPLQVKIFLFVTIKGKKTSEQISKNFKIPETEALEISNSLIDLGSFIDVSEKEFEAMHPRFTIVNMYRRMCKREKIAFTRNKIVDNIGVMLERSYDYARTK